MPLTNNESDNNRGTGDSGSDKDSDNNKGNDSNINQSNRDNDNETDKHNDSDMTVNVILKTTSRTDINFNNPRKL